MSHFTTLVIGDNPDEQLEPFDEGLRVVFTDETADVLAEYNTKTILAIKTAYGEYLHLEPGENADTPGVQAYPANEVYKTLEEYAVDYYGYKKHDGMFGYWGNPNAKWDSYQLGGRWNGYFKAKEGVDTSKFKQFVPHAYVGAKWMEDYSRIKTGWYDSIRKGDVDIQGMIDIAVLEAATEYDKFQAVTRGYEPPTFTWKELVEEHGGERARDIWNDNQWIKRVARELNIARDPIDYFKIKTGGRGAFLQEAAARAVPTFSVIYDGKWYERGGMGWFGIVMDERESVEWVTEWNDIWNSIPDDTMVSVYDLHI